MPTNTIYSEIINLLDRPILELSPLLFTSPNEFQANKEQIQEVLVETARKLQNNYPYPHPLYAGQMLKPPHIVAQLAYMLAMFINPNNHALDGGKASSEMEKEIIPEIAGMFGWASVLGHLTSGGTMANLEALWISGQIHPGKAVAASEMAHYTHERISGVLKIPFLKIKALPDGTMDPADLEEKLKTGSIGTVIATMGTTGMGVVDPLPEIIELQQKYPFRIHADAAYGGYFSLVSNLSQPTAQKFSKLCFVDSIVVDPHKHGLQPYGCGCVLFKDLTVGRFYKHDSPYTYFTSNELHLGEISLECSRAGAAAVALWATMKILPLLKGGQLASRLEKGLKAAQWLNNQLNQSEKFTTLAQPELDIVVWYPKGKSTSEISVKSMELFRKCENRGLHLALFNYPVKLFQNKEILNDSDTITCLRSCLMKPEHEAWKEQIWEIINQE